MDSEDRKKFTGFMRLFETNKPVCESRILRKYNIGRINEALEKGFIKIYNVNNNNENSYIITDEGKKFW